MRSPSGGVSPGALLDEILRGHRGHAGVREVVAEPWRYGAAAALHERLPVRADALELLRSKYKPGRSLKGYYLQRTGPRGAGGVHVAVSWSMRPGDPGDAVVSVLTSPADPAMEQLERLTDIGHVTSLVEQLTGRRVAPARHARVETIRYRPGQRHVLVARFGSQLRPVFVKTDRDHSGASAVPTAQRARKVLVRAGHGVEVVRPLGYVAESSAALWWGAPGRPLSRLVSLNPTVGAAVVERVGRAMRVLHDRLPVHETGCGDGRPDFMDARAEADRVLRAGEHIGVLLPATGSLYARLVSEAVRELEELPGEDPAFVHGDFKCDNILVHLGRPRILDLDRSCAGDPAMDLGKLMADLAWWCRSAPAVSVLHGALLAGYGACDPVRLARAEHWAVLFHLKLAARRCPVHDPDWPVQVRDRTEAAGAALVSARSAG